VAAPRPDPRGARIASSAVVVATPSFEVAIRRLKIRVAFPLIAAGIAVVAHAASSLQNVTIRVTDGSPPTAAATTTGTPLHGGLRVTFKQAGLGNGIRTDYLVTADASATYGCVSADGDHHKAGNPRTWTGPVSAAATFRSDRGGNLTGAIAVAPLPAESLSCAPGQKLVLLAVTYSNVVLTDVSNGVLAGFRGPYALSF